MDRYIGLDAHASSCTVARNPPPINLNSLPYSFLPPFLKFSIEQP